MGARERCDSCSVLLFMCVCVWGGGGGGEGGGGGGGGGCGVLGFVCLCVGGWGGGGGGFMVAAGFLVVLFRDLYGRLCSAKVFGVGLFGDGDFLCPEGQRCREARFACWNWR